MIENASFPPELLSAVGSENKDFMVEARRIQPVGKSILSIVAGILWLIVIGFFIFGVFGPIFRGEEATIDSNGTQVVVSRDNLRPLLSPAIMVGIFFLVGVGMVARGTHCLVNKKSGYFVGTPSKLVYFFNGKVRNMDWTLFIGVIRVSGTAEDGDVSLLVKKGAGLKSQNEDYRSIPKIIYISGVKNSSQIADLCKKRIQEKNAIPANPMG